MLLMIENEHGCLLVSMVVGKSFVYGGLRAIGVYRRPPCLEKWWKIGGKSGVYGETCHDHQTRQRLCQAR